MKKALLIVFCFAVWIMWGPGAAESAETDLNPADLAQLFVKPGQETSLHFVVQNAPADGELSYEVADYTDETMSTGYAEVREHRVAVSVNLSSGYYTLRFPESGEEFGLVAAQPVGGERDEFFCIDSALSWLWGDQDEREELVRILERSGIATSRERLSWGAINPQPDRWEWNAGNDYESLRKRYRRIGVDVLELFHSAPGWTGKIGPYPRDLVGTARSWDRIVDHWKGPWGALEVWNEPDIHFGGNLPADQYVSLVKVLAYEMPPSMKEEALLGGGVFAHCNEHYLELAAANGFLSMVDFVSFHTYGRAPGMEHLVERFHSWLRRHNRASMPLWITECGRPWSRGPGRPATDQDAVSALDITMKGVEARACGVARYFPFVYVYYDERTNNFGMMGRSGTPLRSMAAYVNCVRMLAHTDYLGDLHCESDAVKRARVFGEAGETVVVLYTGEPDPEAAVQLPVKVRDATGIDGRKLKASGRRVPVPDGLTYVRVSRERLNGHLRKNTTAMRLFRESQQPAPERKKAPPVLLQHIPNLDLLSATPEGYTVPRELESALSLSVRAVNLSERAHDIRLEMDGAETPAREAHIRGKNKSTVNFTVPLDAIPSHGDYRRFTISARSETVSDVLPLSINLKRTPTLQSLLQGFEQERRLPIDRTDRWEKLAVGGARLSLSSLEGKGWKMEVSFPEDADPWAFPRFKLPEDIDLSDAKGVVLRARCAEPGIARMLFWETNDGRMTGVDYMTSESIVPEDGEWYSVYVPFDDLVLNRANEPDPNHELDLETVRYISVGLNSDSQSNMIEVSDLYVVSD